MNGRRRFSNMLRYNTPREPQYTRHAPGQIEVYEKKNSNCCYLNFLHEKMYWSITKSIFASFMLIYTSVYFTSETLQTSKYIKSSSHTNSTVFSYAYDLLFVWLLTFFLTTKQMISVINNEHKVNTVLYYVSCHLGAIIFALCGELKFFRNFAITKDFWKHLNPSETIVLSIAACLIIGIGIKEYCDIKSTKYQFRRNIANLLLVSIGYITILAILINGGAQGIHYHVHHAIFSGVLSMWFTFWKNPLEQIMHAVLLGICIQGINFYQLQEFYLFLTKTTPEMTLATAFSINLAFTIASMVVGLWSLI